MTKEEMRVAIAEVCGTGNKFVLMKRGLYWRPNGHGYTYNISEAWILTEDEANKYVYPHDEPVTKHPVPLPDYFNDFNAIREALKQCLRWEKATMSPGGWVHYIGCLCKVFGCRAGWSDDAYLALLTATPAQCAEALCRTLFPDKWT